MDSTDSFNAATAPLTFHDFLDRMRHPAAADLVRSIKSFIVQFLGSPPDPEKDSRSVQNFLSKTEDAFRAHPLWSGATDEEIESAGEGLEKYVMTKLFPRAFCPSPEEIEVDEQLSEKIGRLQQFIRPEHLDIPVHFQNESSWLLAQKELQKINSYKAPRDKLVCILNCCRVINNILLNVTMATNDNPPGADDFLPVLIYVVIGANPPQLHSNILYIQRYRHQSRFVSEAAYFYTNLASAEEFLKNLGPLSLSMDPGEYERRMQAGGDAQHVAEQSVPLKAAEVTLSGQDILEPQISSIPTVSPKGEAVPPEVEQEVPVQKEEEIETGRLPSPLIRSHSIPPSQILEEYLDRGLSVLDLVEQGGGAVVEAHRSGELKENYRYLYATVGELTVEDCYQLLQDYKELVWKYMALATTVEDARHVKSFATQTEAEAGAGTWDDVSSQQAEVSDRITEAGPGPGPGTWDDVSVQQPEVSDGITVGESGPHSIDIEDEQVDSQRSVTASTPVEEAGNFTTAAEAMFDTLGVHAPDQETPSDSNVHSEGGITVQQEKQEDEQL